MEYERKRRKISGLQQDMFSLLFSRSMEECSVVDLCSIYDRSISVSLFRAG